MTGRIAIFAKTIGLSSVKTRLAKDLGVEKAEAFYRLSVAAVAELMAEVEAQSNRGIQPCWALAEEQAVGLDEWRGFRAIWTGDGDLGQRLSSVSSRLGDESDFVLLIGTDSPQLNREVFVEAIDLLKSKPQDCVVGPSADGGFYLFGFRCAIEADIWKQVTYSVDTTLAELSGLIEAGGRKIHRLETELDVDTISDLDELENTLVQRREKLLPAQNTLLIWLKNLS